MFWIRNWVAKILESTFLKQIIFGLLVLFLLVGSRDAMAISKIAGIEVQGVTKVDPAQIKAAMSNKVGQAYAPNKLNEDIQAIQKLGYFSDVKIAKSGSGAGLVLVVKVIEQEPITLIEIKGAKKVNEKRVRETLGLQPNMPATEAKIQSGIEKLKALYAEEGYKRAAINYNLTPVTGGSKLKIQIEENENIKVRGIEFTGNTVMSERKLRKLLSTKKKGLFSFMTGSGKFKDELVERDVAFITYNYLNKGYMRVQVAPPEITYSEKKKGLVLTFNVVEGDAYNVGMVEVAGDILTTREQFLKEIKIKTGQPYNQAKVEADLTRFQEIYGNQGYAFADIKPQIQVDDASKLANLVYVFDRGKKIFIEKINIGGNDVTRDKVIRRELKIKENSLYNESLVKLSKRKLYQLGFFENVEFSTPRGSSDNQLNLNVHVKERATGSFSVGAGFSSVENFILTASISKQNFLGLGISGNLSAELSSRRQQFMLNYINPYFLDSNFLLSFSGYKILSQYDDFDRDSLGGELSLGRRLFDFTNFSIGYRIEDVQLQDFSLIVPEYFKRNQDGLTSSAVANLTHDTRDNALSPSKGDYENISVEYAGNGLGGDNDFLRVIGNARYYLALPGKTVLKTNLRLGWIKSLNGDSIPLFERFFTGGINSLRGFDLRSVGPRIQIPGSPTGGDEEFVYGGNKLMVFNLEYEFPIYPSGGFRGVIFLDAGNAYAENEDLNPLKVRTNVGIGFRWVSPFGPLRFEWGFPIKKREGEDFSVFNFTIGSSF